MENKNSQIFKERINVERAKYLMSISDDKMKEIIKRDENDWNGENIYSNLDNYIKNLRKWLKKGINEMNSKGFIETKYKSSKALVSVGREYVVGFGIQKLVREIKGFLCDGLVQDIDIINSAPSTLLNIMKKHFPEVETPFLSKYVSDRESFFKDGIKKQDVIIALNTNKKSTSSNRLFRKLDNEFKIIQKLIWNQYEKKVSLPDVVISKKNTMKQNKEGKYLNLILTIKENEILQKAVNILGDKIETKIFDGFHIKFDENNINIINMLNTLTEEDGIKWTIKEFDKSVKQDEGVDIDYLNIPTYKECKRNFEESHFMIENPIIYGRIYSVNGHEKYQFYKKESFRELCNPIVFYDPEDGREKEFFIQWLKDPNRRSYKEVGFIPSKNSNPEIFNSFKGFNFEKLEDYQPEEKDDEIIETYLNHLSLLTNHDKKSIDYLNKYIAHLIQKPEQKPRVAVMLKSKEGFGKDTLITMIENLINKRHIFTTAEIEDVFGTYNIGLRDKLVLVLNEVEGKHGFSNKEKLKNIITENSTIIREKFVSQYDQINYLRLFILSNNINPVEISQTDRRYVVFKAHHKKPLKSYFDKLHNMIDDDESMNKLFQYLSNVDISDFKPDNDRPKTDAYLSMKEHNINPIYKFLNIHFIKGNINEWFAEGVIRKNKKNHCYYVKSNDFFNSYRQYLENLELDFLKINSKTIKAILGDIGIKKKSVRIEGCPNDYYVVNPEDLSEQLKDMNLDDDIEEFDDDDFE